MVLWPIGMSGDLKVFQGDEASLLMIRLYRMREFRKADLNIKCAMVCGIDERIGSEPFILQ